MNANGSPLGDPLSVESAPADVPKGSDPGLTAAALPLSVPLQASAPGRTALTRPQLAAGRPSRAAVRRPPSRAISGAAVAVGGVVLGIGSLLWVTGEPPRTEPTGASTAPLAQAPTAEAPMVQAQTAQAPSAQTAPAEAETAPSDPTALAVAPPALPAEEPPAPPPVPVARPASPVVPVTVLNNSRTIGLAGRAAKDFRDAGWPVAQTGNITGRFRATTVYYAAGQEETARAFARRFGGVERVLPRFDGLPGRGLTIVLTSDYA